ncbi:hypothetical protein DFH08DRAFT_824671 [Mycena albidolilacea]|uniref:Uncharacterized protein n=1 Tax=Mycena albidolilacea TaxID=1033008 RepID=A0AAD7EA84_9AGAR|nr:hypothetical protein DFH08DRAFT_824671 [Mycena albidolilacea]
MGSYGMGFGDGWGGGRVAIVNGCARYRLEGVSLSGSGGAGADDIEWSRLRLLRATSLPSVTCGPADRLLARWMSANPGLRAPAILLAVFPLHRRGVHPAVPRAHVVVEAMPAIGIDGSTDGKSGVEKPKATGVAVPGVEGAKARQPLAADIHADARSLAHHARPPIPMAMAGEWGVAMPLAILIPPYPFQLQLCIHFPSKPWVSCNDLIQNFIATQNWFRGFSNKIVSVSRYHSTGSQRG